MCHGNKKTLPGIREEWGEINSVLPGAFHKLGVTIGIDEC